MLGNRAIYHDGWVAATTPATLPWELSTETPPDVITGYNWELYNVDEDPTQYNDLAKADAGEAEGDAGPLHAGGAKYGVLPLDNSTLARWITPRPSLTAGRTRFDYFGQLSGVPSKRRAQHPEPPYTHHGGDRDARAAAPKASSSPKADGSAAMGCS